MYHCLDCGADFDEPVFWQERHGLAPDEGPGETWSGCPECLGAFEEVFVTGECCREAC